MSYKIIQISDNIHKECIKLEDVRKELARAKSTLKAKQQSPNENEVLFYTESELKSIINDKESYIDALKERIKLFAEKLKEELENE